MLMAMSKALAISFNAGQILWSDSISIYSRYAAVQIDVSIMLNYDPNRFKYLVPNGLPILGEIMKMYA